MLEPGILEPCLVVEHLPPYVGIVNAISIPIHFRFRVKTKRHGEDDESMLFDNFVMVETYDLQRTKNEKRRIFLIPIRRKRLFRELKNGTFIRFRQFHKVLPPLNELEGFSKELLEMMKDESCFVAGKNSKVVLDQNHQKEDYRAVEEIVNRGRTEVTVSRKVEMTPEAMHRNAGILLNGRGMILNFSYVAPTAACDDG
ncbi:unnamed protein product [Cyprideis torosa]|uniref:Uncharacterized protein n=1 Tax=Cyprideis torosa TaxID=163714 RepID=A0A7R8ZV94_9CRUS|nr:unnamed protein product [Cyprideis torosa]CAG0902157.1 unnamed protein product [Cyprideis torosa]